MYFLCNKGKNVIVGLVIVGLVCGLWCQEHGFKVGRQLGPSSRWWLASHERQGGRYRDEHLLFKLILIF